MSGEQIPGVLGRRLLIIGHARHGKDTAGLMLAQALGWSYVSSSEACGQKAVYPLCRDLYPDWRACFDDREHNREMWFHAIAAYNLRPGPTIAEQMLDAFGIYVGMRKRSEFDRIRPTLSNVIWVDASDRLPPEDPASMELTAADADIVLDNNGPESRMREQIHNLIYL